MASTAEKLDPELWEEAKADAREKFGGHSARAMQYAVKLYKERGGRYRGKKKQDNRLTQWAAQDWTTKSGRPSKETGERYLPRDAIAALTSAEYGATTRAKRAGGGVGQSVAQPKSIREKTRKFRKVNPMATPAQIAARKKFAERARSGELAKMRKKNPVKKPTRAASRKANPSSKWTTKISNPYYFDRYGDKGLTVVAEKTTMEEGYAPVDLAIIYNEPRGVYQFAHGNVIEKEHTPSLITAKKIADLWYETNKKMFTMTTPRRSNPTATRAPARNRTKLMSNGERKKNPRVRYADIAGPSVAEFKTVYAVHLAGQPSMNAMAYFTTKKNAVDTAQFLADETGKQVKVTRIQIAFN